jgi:hypothetical protein
VALLGIVLTVLRESIPQIPHLTQIENRLSRKVCGPRWTWQPDAPPSHATPRAMHLPVDIPPLRYARPPPRKAGGGDDAGQANIVAAGYER